MGLSNLTKHLANMITLSNLVFGFLSLRATVLGNYKLAALFILISVVMDSLDGRVARHFDAVGDIGKNLDSLSDLVSFGVAPAMLAYVAYMRQFDIAGIIVAILFCLAGSYRLARFNSSIPEDHFVGVPITFAGGLVAIFAVLGSHIHVYAWYGIMLGLSALMISYLKVPKTGTKKQSEHNL